MLSWLPAVAQTRAAGPWRVVYQPLRYRPHQAGWGDEEWSTPPSPAVKSDTATAVRLQRKLQRVPWDVQPDSITLFLGCQNPLRAPATLRGKLAPVRFKATGATVRLDPKQQLLLLVPSAAVVVLRAYRGQQVVFRHEFKAVPPPPPTIKCYPSGCAEANDATTPGKEHLLRTITLRALPDLDFFEMLPEDARYRVARFRATLLRQGRPIAPTPGQATELLIQGPQGDMSDLNSSSEPDDQLQVDILLVQRLNSLGIITEVPAAKQFVLNDIKCPKQE